MSIRQQFVLTHLIYATFSWVTPFPVWSDVALIGLLWAISYTIPRQ